MLRLILLFLPLTLHAQVREEKLLKVKEQHNTEEQSTYQPVYQRNTFVPYWQRPYTPYFQTPSREPLPVSIGGVLSLPAHIQLPLFGLYTTIGDERALYLHFAASKQNQHNHYTNITRADVIEWGDTIQTTYNQRTDFGAGIVLRKESPVSHVMGLNLYTLNQDLLIKDPLNILPYPGEELYSIDLNNKTGINIMYGILYHYNSLEIGIQCFFLSRPSIQAVFGISI